ncbi:phycobilisome rod-core linker polypeptide [Leptothoe spongobia]|uniref:Phycobilisome rod-core linker polypeptide n=1 Tax=Leptothoe spongobia TAU-MAC 1115 TaxID=1967444 RepID=A0A947DH51_9CYAN|nr:phycobilisome rod-core linker polypeptide [Leptothoe spongobia]MBT9316790.1 phycobilisome rod-core linker polypeptide [Leptothoe spongobia TAU-MAC 1115]
MALWVADSATLELRPNATEDEVQVVINAVYKQVLGNMHVMDNMRLTSAESFLRNGDITVRGFVRAVAKSDLYRAAFFETSSPYQLIELNFKHLLGRAPQDQSEIAEHVAIYNGQGYDADIDSYLDSAEYLGSFGEDVVPYVRGAQSQIGYKNVNFNRTFALVRGDATSDRGRSARLIGSVAGNLTSKISAPRGGSGTYSNTGKRFRIKASTSSAAAAINRVSNQEYLVSYGQMSKTIQNVLKRGGKIVSITEAGY